MFHKILTSERLVLEPMQVADAPFILELVNTPGWLTFIGDRQVSSLESAVNYINTFDNNADALFWVVKSKSEAIPLGVVSFIQRSYLPYRDIGFAFLPQYSKKGYAFEAANRIFEHVKQDPDFQVLLATTLTTNENSQRLLEKLGLIYIQKITVGEELLMVYSSTGQM
ncbi:GNAT family N-acetyltransferase [Flavobacterium sp. JP2137]|uniref:GNAT family N-acetyltransferase n=1 Tax=Flavobacterium sp. JP2137 TaxID=3414510 RepID=UPI003D2FF552